MSNQKSVLTAKKRAETDEARIQLLELLKPGDTVYCILRHVSRSGMCRVIDLVIPRWNLNDNKLFIRSIGRSAAEAINQPHNGQWGGIRISGVGMDMGFALVYALGSALWPDGTMQPHSMRNDQPDTSGGYALKCQWL